MHELQLIAVVRDPAHLGESFDAHPYLNVDRIINWVAELEIATAV